VIYLVRQGQTVWNQERRIQGHGDSPLTELGVRQAGAVAGLLADLLRGEADGWRIVSSPLGRAAATAEVIGARLGLSVELDERLKEMSWGEHDGRLRRELELEYPDTFGRTNWAFDVPSGETYDDVAERVGGWLAELPPEADRRIIAVSHGITGRVLRGLYAGMGRDQAATQDVPQDAVFLLQHGRVGRIDTEAVE
jgi:probable phosphoglycerate mutase